MEKEIERMYMFVITLYTGQERISRETIASRMTKGKKKRYTSQIEIETEIRI